jgi:hypothetical protein
MILVVNESDGKLDETQARPQRFTLLRYLVRQLQFVIVRKQLKLVTMSNKLWSAVCRYLQGRYDVARGCSATESGLGGYSGLCLSALMVLLLIDVVTGR